MLRVVSKRKKIEISDSWGSLILEFIPCGIWKKNSDRSFTASAENWTWEIDVDDAIFIRCRHTGKTPPVKSPECRIIVNEKSDFRMLVHDPIFGSMKTGIAYLSKDDEFWGGLHETSSSLFALLFDRGTNFGILTGTIPPVHDDSRYIFNNNVLECCFFQTPPNNPGVELDLLMLKFGSNYQSLLFAYADQMPKLPEKVRRKVITGWNSWDYYFQTVCEADIAENVDALRACPEISGKIEYIILDDGWQNGYGDWETSSRFHGDLSRTVRLIKDAGYKPGIWVAPFVADYYSKLSLRHPEMLARNASGGYDFFAGGNGGVGIVDPTQPEAEAMIRRLFSSLRKMGFEYFKVDFVHRLLSQNCFYNAERRIDMVTYGMKIIRQSIGEDAVLAGCGMPIYGGYGIVDSMRIAGDISTFWSNICSSAREIAATSFLNRKAWVNDCDFLLVRSPVTTDEKQYNPFFLKQPYKPFVTRSGDVISALNETQVWCTLVILSGGSVILGDHFGKLNNMGRRLISTVMQYVSDTSGQPLDLFDGGIPQKWRCGSLYAFFNWQDEPEEIRHRLDNKVAHGREIWSGESLRFIDSVYCETIAPHSVRLIEVASE